MKCYLPWQETGTGLSGIVEGQLGMRLDKGLQCSSWGLRPLSPEQLHYAALDAAVLLMLLDSIIAAALPSTGDPSLPPHGDPRTRHSSAAKAPLAGSGFDASSSADSQDAGAQSHRKLPLLSNTADEGLGQPDALDTTLEGRKTAQSDEDWHGTTEERQDSACTASGAAQAAEALQQLSMCSVVSSDASINDTDGRKSATDLQYASLAADIRRAGACQHRGEQHGSHQAAGMNCSISMLVPAAVSAAELHEAAQLWGSRLEVGGACRQGVPKPSKEKRLGIRARLGQVAESADHLGEQRWL